MKINLVTRVSGRFKIESFTRNGPRRVRAGWFCNIITNGGLDRIGANAVQISACHVGSGSTTPAATDTALVARIASTSSVQSNNVVTTGTSPYYVAQQRVFRFGEGVAAGNLSEIGIGWQTTTPWPLFSRALILDSMGSPTTITVASNEFLDVTYELRHYPPLVDGSGIVTLDGVDYDWISRAMQAGNAAWVGTNGIASAFTAATAYNGAIGAITSSPAGSSTGLSVSASSYTNGNYYRDNVVTAALGSGNLAGGIKCIGISSGGTGYGAPRYQIEFDPAIPKDATNALSLTFRHSWARASI